MVALPRFLLRHPHRLLSLSSAFSASPFFLSQHAPATTSRRFFGHRRFRCHCSRVVGPRPANWGSFVERVRLRRVGSGSGVWGSAGEGRDHQWKAKRRWWSDETYDDEWDDDFDLLDDDFETPWEKIWIFKVFKSYGYFLPVIIASTLLATGPKAFLMALALPLGQSVLSLAVDKLWGNVSRETSSRGTRPKSKRKKKPFTRSPVDFRREDEEEIRSYQDGKAYQSWMAPDTAVNNRETKSPAFGGWDELDRQRKYDNGPSRQGSSKTASEGSTRGPPVRKGKLSRRERNKDVPLLLRLLIAVFPFLGSWTRIL